MSTNTPNYNFILPGVNEPTDQDLWGGELNTNFSSLDTILKTISDASSTSYIGDYKVSAQVADHGKWLILNATVRNVSRTTYASLFALLGTTWGIGDGTTTFGLPPAGDRFPLLAGSAYTIGQTGGESTHTLVIGEIPPATTNITTGGSNTVTPTDNLFTTSPYSSSVTATHSFTSNGGGGAHNNMPPYAVLGNAFIYAGV